MFKAIQPLFQRARRFAIGGFAVFGASVMFGCAAAAALETHRQRIEDGSVLTLDMRRSLVETKPRGPFDALLSSDGDPLVLREVLDALEHAERDPRVRGLVLRVGGPGVGFAVTQELHDAVRAFSRAPAKKFSLAFAETFGELQNGNEAYVLATACDEIYVQPSGDVALGGLISDEPFLKRLLDRIGVAARIEARGEYKNAPNSLTEMAFTPHHREATEHLLKRTHSQMLSMVAEGRRITTAAAAAAFREGPFSVPEALQRSLIDSASYRDQAVAHAKDLALTAGDGSGVPPPSVRLLPVDQYHKAVVEQAQEALEKAGAPTIGIVYAIGDIQLGSNTEYTFGADKSCWSDEVTSALRKATEDEDIEAVVMRVDSPGGSVVASDSIARAAELVRDAGKPLVISMGNYAASGGYFISANADRIVAWPGTITGSIGVFGGKVVLRDAWEKLGVAFDTVTVGGDSSAKFGSSLWDYDAHGRERLAASLDRIYRDFVQRVADGRKMPFLRALELAKGRAWTGADALRVPFSFSLPPPPFPPPLPHCFPSSPPAAASLCPPPPHLPPPFASLPHYPLPSPSPHPPSAPPSPLGLVDEAGGLRAAVRAAKAAAGIPSDTAVVVRELGPGARWSLARAIKDLLEDDREEEGDLVSISAGRPLSSAAAAIRQTVEVASIARAALDAFGLQPALGQLAQVRALEGSASVHAGPAPGSLQLDRSPRR
eukprot:tig00020930_g16017.t1